MASFLQTSFVNELGTTQQKALEILCKTNSVTGKNSQEANEDRQVRRHLLVTKLADLEEAAPSANVLILDLISSVYNSCSHGPDKTMTFL